MTATSPYGHLIFDQQGNLYGTTQFGGNNGDHGKARAVIDLAPHRDSHLGWKLIARLVAIPPGAIPTSLGNLVATSDSLQEQGIGDGELAFRVPQILRCGKLRKLL